MALFLLSESKLRSKLKFIVPGIWVMAWVACLHGAAQTLSLASREEFHGQPFFELNEGQVEPEALYLVNGPGYSAQLGHSGVTLTFPRSAPSGTSLSVRLQFLGASAQPEVQGIDEQQGKSNYFSGSDPAHWRTGIPHFARVAYRQIYPGIDLLFYFHAGQLEYDVQLQPGSDLNKVRLLIQGAGAALSPQGDVVISSNQTELLKIKKPRVYQPPVETSSIPAKYVLRDHVLSISAGQYDHSRELVIDPALAFSIFLGPNCVFGPLSGTIPACDSTISDLAVNDTGIYVVGYTDASSFPALAGQPPATNVGERRTVVVKLDPTGSNVIYTTFLAGSRGASIAVDSSGGAFITGTAFAGIGAPFPLTAGSFSSQLAAFGNPELPFAAKLSPDGSTLVYSTFLMLDSGNPNIANFLDIVILSRITVDSSGALYVSGTDSAGDTSFPTRASTLPFPTTIGSFQTTRPGPNSVFVMKLNPSGSALEYSTYVAPVFTMGGLAVDSSGAAYVTGSALPGYPTTAGAYQTANPSPTGAPNAVVTKLTADGSALAYSTFFGGASPGQSNDIAVTSTGEAVFTGFSFGPPTTPGAVCTATPDDSELAFVAKLNATGSDLVYSTTLCQDAQTFDQGQAVAIDSTGGAYVAAFVGDQPNPPFPFLNPIQTYFFAPVDNTTGIVSLDSSGGLRWGTFLGSMGDQASHHRIAVDNAGGVYLLHSFLTTAGAFQPVPFNDGTYLAKIVPSLGSPVPVLQPRSIDFHKQLIGTSSQARDVVIGNFGDAALGTPTITISGDYSQTNTCSAPVSAGQKCDANVIFIPTAAGTRTGTLTVHFGGSLADQTVALTGIGTVPTAVPSPTSLTFPPQALNTTSSAKPISIANNGTGPLSITSIQATGDFAQTNACGAPVQPGSNCNVLVTFTPTAQGTRQGSLTLTDNALNSPQTVPLSGFGGQAAVVSLNPASLNFSVPQNVGSSSSTIPVVLTNVGNAALNIAHITIAGDVTQTNNCGVVAAGDKCTLQVSFSPIAAGPRNATVTITDDSITSPEVVTVSGIGVDFTFPAPPGPTTATINAGQTATYTLTASSMGGSSETVSFSCSGLPSLSACTISPPSTTLTGILQNFTVTITTTAPSAIFKVPEASPILPLLLLAIVSASSILMMRNSKRTRLAVFSSVIMVVLWAGCGGGGGGGKVPGTPSGTYTVVVTGTATSGGSLSHSTNVTLVVK